MPYKHQIEDCCARRTPNDICIRAPSNDTYVRGDPKRHLCTCTADGIYILRRLQIKRCGRLDLKAVLAPDCCPAAARNINTELFRDIYHHRCTGTSFAIFYCSHITIFYCRLPYSNHSLPEIFHRQYPVTCQQSACASFGSNSKKRYRFSC